MIFKGRINLSKRSYAKIDTSKQPAWKPMVPHGRDFGDNKGKLTIIGENMISEMVNSNKVSLSLL